MVKEPYKQVLRNHTHAATDKFITEICWRTYWKGWLECRPDFWRTYRSTLQQEENAVQNQSGMRPECEATCLGQTGVSCFDHW